MIIKLYPEPCIAARLRVLFASSLLIIFVIACIKYEFQTYALMFFCASMAFWLIIYIDKLLISTSSAAIGWALTRLILIPPIVTTMLFATLEEDFSSWAATEFDKYLSGALLGIAMTANSLFEDGFTESAVEMKAYFFISFPLLLFFGAELLVSSLSIAGRIKDGGNLDRRIAATKEILYGTPLLILFLTVPFLINSYNPECTGRRCSLAGGFIGLHLVFSHIGIVLAFMLIAAILFSRMVVTVLITMKKNPSIS